MELNTEILDRIKDKVAKEDNPWVTGYEEYHKKYSFGADLWHQVCRHYAGEVLKQQPAHDSEGREENIRLKGEISQLKKQLEERDAYIHEANGKILELMNKSKLEVKEKPEIAAEIHYRDLHIENLKNDIAERDARIAELEKEKLRLKNKRLNLLNVIRAQRKSRLASIKASLAKAAENAKDLYEAGTVYKPSITDESNIVIVW